MLFSVLLVCYFTLHSTYCQVSKEESYMKGSIDVARCRASCVDKVCIKCLSFYSVIEIFKKLQKKRF